METKVSEIIAIEICSMLHFTNLERSNPIGFRGGIWVLWNEATIELDITSLTQQAIHAITKDWEFEPTRIKSSMLNHFQNLYSTAPGARPQCRRCPSPAAAETTAAVPASLPLLLVGVAASQLAAPLPLRPWIFNAELSAAVQVPFKERRTGTSFGIRRKRRTSLQFVCRSNDPHNSGIRAQKRLQLSGALVDRRLPRVDLPDPRELLSSVDLAQGSIL
ncbi:hypothetical protein M9H77_13559 [Catharanthus roseus]|uniref:Uncharacterized protein n=1 Tax=Catharanthus roseus TaxID=4058 RepID=A0ACC0BKK8_CATRO|nr:hypothetical protein M9H77_13559 [Catharanthus roseus]